MVLGPSNPTGAHDGANLLHRVHVDTTFPTGAETREIKAAVSGKILRVVRAQWTCDVAGITRFKSNTTQITDFLTSANGVRALEKCPEGWFDTVVDEALQVTHAGSSSALKGTFFIEEITP